MNTREVICHPMSDTDDTINIKRDENGLLTIDVAVTPIICSKEQGESLYLALHMLYNEPLA